MTASGVSAYQRTGIDTSVAAANPHELVLMLYDGALEAVRQAKSKLASGDTAAKGVALSKAVRIVEEGLKASIDRNAGGALAAQLSALYDYATLRLLQANLRNDAAALAEVARLLEDLRSAWAQISKSAPVVPVASATAARLGMIGGGADAPRRGFAVTA